MQNRSRGFSIAPVKYHTGVIDSSRKYFSWPSLLLVAICLCFCQGVQTEKRKDDKWIIQN
jgi:hypothetical protein